MAASIGVSSSQRAATSGCCFCWLLHGRAGKDQRPKPPETADGPPGGSERDEPARTVVKEKLVPIPQVTLTADDYDPLQPGPPSTAAPTDRLVEFGVPAGTLPGCTLVVPLTNETVKVTLPEHVRAGDPIHMCQRADGSWRISRKASKFSLVVPDCAPGDTVRLQKGPDGFPISLEIPKNSEPGDILRLKRDKGTTWVFDGVQRVQTPVKEPAAYDLRNEQDLAGSYREMLNVLHAKIQSLKKLTMSESGVLRMNVPFCGRFYEYAVLGSFVATNLLTLPGVAGARVVATELNDDYVISWAMAQRWFNAYQPGVQLEIYAMDLSQDPLPNADITIAVHPEVTKGGHWFPIIGSILRSGARGGLVLFATFYMAEAETLVNMVHMYANDGTYVEVIENPWYTKNELPSYPPMRYLVVVSSECPSGYTKDTETPTSLT
mmetsp:Transcript_101068/g.286430  ORF Transcript_101068/g.286430 Transcript_101068/m.286430 type:complete len:435 (+) Transcript_101068:25-1329(+)